MNVDKAMAIVDNYRGWLSNKRVEMTSSEIVAITLAAEVERLRAELAQFRKDWCDDDEAIKQQALRVLNAKAVEGDSAYVPRMGALAEMMADEIERLSVWNKRWRDVSAKLRLTVAHLSEELAAAKAASVVPVRVLNIFEGTYESDRYIELRTDAEADTFTDWLRERMKGGEG